MGVIPEIGDRQVTGEAPRVLSSAWYRNKTLGSKCRPNDLHPEPSDRKALAHEGGRCPPDAGFRGDGSGFSRLCCFAVFFCRSHEARGAEGNQVCVLIERS